MYAGEITRFDRGTLSSCCVYCEMKGCMIDQGVTRRYLLGVHAKAEAFALARELFGLLHLQPPWRDCEILGTVTVTKRTCIKSE